MARKVTNNPALLGHPRSKWPDLAKITLWSKCAGRCEICNRFLLENPYTGDKVNLGEFAHIIAHSPNGPRGSSTLSDQYKDNIDNILLLCHDCHKTVDSEPLLYPVEELRRLKDKHETKICQQTEPTNDDSRKIIIFTAPINGQHPEFDSSEASSALKRDGEFPIGKPVILKYPNQTYFEKDAEYWNAGVKYIDRGYKEDISQYLENSDKIAVFAIAPQPLLVYLGWKLGNIRNISVYQKHRYQPSTWTWPKNKGEKGDLIITQHSKAEKEDIAIETIALSFSISFDIKDRIASQLPSNSLHWDVRPSAGCSTEYASCADKLTEFRMLAQNLLNDIHKKVSHLPLHIYMALPVSMAVCLGMCILPKATNDMILHDYIISQNKDIETIHIKVCQ